MQYYESYTILYCVSRWRFEKQVYLSGLPFRFTRFHEYFLGCCHESEELLHFLVEVLHFSIRATGGPLTVQAADRIYLSSRAGKLPRMDLTLFPYAYSCIYMYIFSSTILPCSNWLIYQYKLVEFPLTTAISTIVFFTTVFDFPKHIIPLNSTGILCL